MVSEAEQNRACSVSSNLGSELDDVINPQAPWGAKMAGNNQIYEITFNFLEFSFSFEVPINKISRLLFYFDVLFLVNLLFRDFTVNLSSPFLPSRPWPKSRLTFFFCPLIFQSADRDVLAVRFFL